MSDAHGHATDDHPADDHAHDHAHDFDPEPASELSEGEPQTPAWLPLLGAGLFLVGGIYFLAGRSSAETTPASTTASAVVAPPAAPSMAAPRAAADGSARQPRPRPPSDPADRARVLEAVKAKAAADRVVPPPTANPR